MKVRHLIVKNDILHDIIKDVWILDDFSGKSENYKLLPLKEIDFMVNLSGTIKYSSLNSDVVSGDVFSNVIREKPVGISQKGCISVAGVSFNSYSYQALEDISIGRLIERLIERFNALRRNSAEDNAELFISLLAEEIKENLIPSGKIRNIVKYFDIDAGKTKLENICCDIGISLRTAERIFGNYVNMPPKKYMKLLRFRNSLRKIVSAQNESLTDAAYDCGYYDQSHFCDEFKSFTDLTPRNFLEQKNSVMQKMQNN